MADHKNGDDAGIRATGTKVGARFVPFPRSISAHAQAVLANFVACDGTPPVPPIYPAPSDLAGWAKLKAVANDRIARMFAAMLTEGAAASIKPIETLEVDGVAVHAASPIAAFPDDRAYIDIHGGALVFGEGEACRLSAATAAALHGVRCYAIDYCMPPVHPYPAALDDCVAVYRALLGRYEPKNIIVGGASAGGNLAAALMLRARDEGLPLPAALVLMTPEIDLTESGDSFEVNRTVDVVIGSSLMTLNRLYAGGHDLAHPYLSPLFGDFTKGFPPSFLQAGTRDMFLSNAVRLHRALRRADIPVELHVFEGMPHGGFYGAPEDLEVQKEVARFVAAHWGRSA